MKVMRLENEQFALEIPLQEEYIKIKRYEPYGQPIDKATITTITEDMYIEWELSERHNNIRELLQSTQEHKNSIQSLVQSVCDCCKYKIYAEQDILDYQNFIEQQDDDDDEIESSKKYYDSRAIIDGMNKDFTPSILIEYNASNSGEIPQKNKNFPFWIEVHTNEEQVSVHICLRADVVNLLIGNINFILNAENKYVLLEACRVFAALNDNRKIIQKTFTICLDLFKIAQAFNLNPDTYKLDEPAGENSYRISPKYKGDEIIIDEIYSPKIFNLYSLAMVRCVFNSTVKLIKETGMDTALSQNIVFRRCSFKEGVFIAKMCIEKKITFENCIFDNFSHNYCAYFDDAVFLERASFQQSIFKSRASFMSSVFKSKAFFSLATFEKEASFRETVFEDNAYFDDTEFKDVAEFKLGEFHKNAHFYGTEFKEFPNFIQVIFNENVNFINTKSNIKFEKAKEQIERLHLERKISYENQAEEDRGDKEEPKEYKIANEFRDSFRNIKSALIEHHSMLDASNYHRTELYCKELELKYKREEKAKNFWDTFKFLLDKKRTQALEIRDIIDEIQLCCYRLTSDHHTNLLLILNNVLILIAMFGIANLVLDALNQNGEAFICIAFLIISILLMIFRTTFTAQKNFRRCLIIIKRRKKKIFLLLTCLIRCCAVVGAYVMTIYTIFTTPSSILPILGKLIENKSAEVCLFVVGNVKMLCYDNTHYSQTLNLIYMLFLFLLLWSLQKTARKNTIVPS